MRWVVATLTLTVSSAALAEPDVAHTVSLDEAVREALQHNPTLRQARASSVGARARADEALAPLLPQVTASASYQRATGNYASRPGNVPSGLGVAAARPSFATFDYYSGSITSSLLLFDFGQTYNGWRAARANAVAQRSSVASSRQQVVYQARSAFLTARTQKALLEVSQAQLANQSRHVSQVRGFVEVGTRPQVDLAQALTDQANARVQVIQDENAYGVAKAQLVQVMGLGRGTDFEVTDDTLAAVPGEDRRTEDLLFEALRARPDLMALNRQIQAQELTTRAEKGAYGPALVASTGLSEQGPALDNLVYNWNVQATLTWQLFQGGLTLARVREANATLDGLIAQRDALIAQIRVQVEQARTGVRAAKAVLVAAEEALTNARDQLRLAEGRYEVGLGNIIELGDAQVAETNAAVQKVQAQYSLASARAALLQTLGR